MDIDLLSKMVKELILEKDRVVLPGLGCFVAEMVPSTFSDKGYTINPPYRRLSFRPRPDMGDELIDFYVEANHLDRDVACRILGDFIRELRQIIFSKKVVVLPGLGRLRATKENNLFFIPDEDLDIYPAGIGLEPISLKSHVETRQEVASAISGLKSIMDDVLGQETDVRVEAESVDAGEETCETGGITQTEEEVVRKVTEDGLTVREKAEEGAAEKVEEQESEPAAVVIEKPKRPVGKRLLICFVVLVLVAALLLGLFVGISRLNPEIFDSILYSPEELEILNHK
jgi:nucleoid DNA-binding protein